MLIDTFEEICNRLPIGDLFPFDGSIFTLPYQIVEKRWKPLECLDIHAVEGSDKGCPVRNFRMRGVAQVRSHELFFNVAPQARHQFRWEIVPQFVTHNAIDAATRNSVEPIHGPSMRLDKAAMGRERRMSQGCIEDGLFPIDQYISDAGIHRSIFIEDLEMAQETGGKITVAGTELQDREG